jgi:uncharacterized protein HemY
MSDRISHLEHFIRQDPSDPFNYYALGLEYVNRDKHKALGLFQYLMKEHKNYVPTYYQLAKLYEEMGQKENAIQAFNNGILIARQQNDLKTLRELNAGLLELDND